MKRMNTFQIRPCCYELDYSAALENSECVMVDLVRLNLSQLPAADLKVACFCNRECRLKLFQLRKQAQ